MANMNWNKTKPRYANLNSNRLTAMKLQKTEQHQATEKQLLFMKILYIEYPKNITKVDALFLIKRCLDLRNSSNVR